MAAAAVSHGGVETLSAFLSHPNGSIAIAAASSIDAAVTAMMVARQSSENVPGSTWPAWAGEQGAKQLPGAPKAETNEPHRVYPAPAFLGAISALYGTEIAAEIQDEVGDEVERSSGRAALARPLPRAESEVARAIRESAAAGNHDMPGTPDSTSASENAA